MWLKLIKWLHCLCYVIVLYGFIHINILIQIILPQKYVLLCPSTEKKHKD